MEEVKFLFRLCEKNSGQEQVRDRVKREAAVLGQVWGIEKRRFGGDWGKKMWLFDALVWAVMYGVEIWGRREREGIERM